MRLRASLLAGSAALLCSSSAFAGWAIVSTVDANPATYLSKIDDSKAPVYTTSLGPVVKDDAGQNIVLGAIAELGQAELGVPEKAGVLFGVGRGIDGTGIPLYEIVVAPGAMPGEYTATAKQVQLLAFSDPMDQVLGAGFDRQGALHVLFLTLSSTSKPTVVRYDAQGTGVWSQAQSVVLGLPPLELGATAQGGDVVALDDGSLLISLVRATGASTSAPLYYTQCRGGDAVPFSNPPVAGNLEADGLASGTNVLGVSSSLSNGVVFAPNTGAFPPASPFLTGFPGTFVYTLGDLAAIIPVRDSDSDGVSDAAEGACANVRSVTGVGLPDFQDPDIDDDCVRDDVDVDPSAADPTIGRRTATFPNANADLNCRATAGVDGADDGSICLSAGDPNSPSCVPGCRPGVAGSGCPGTLVCNVPTGAVVGSCQVAPPPPAGGMGGMGGAGMGGAGQAGSGQAGRGGVGIQGQDGGAGGQTSGSGVGEKSDAGSGEGCSITSNQLGATSGRGAFAAFGLGLLAAFGLGLRRRR